MIIEEKKCVRFGLGMLLKVKAVVWRAGFNPADCSSSIKISNHTHLSKIFSAHKTKKYWFSKSISEYKNLTEADETIFTEDFYLNPNFRVWIRTNSRANTHEKQLLEIPPSEKKIHMPPNMSQFLWLQGRRNPLLSPSSSSLHAPALRWTILLCPSLQFSWPRKVTGPCSTPAVTTTMPWRSPLVRRGWLSICPKKDEQLKKLISSRLLQAINYSFLQCTFHKRERKAAGINPVL